LWTFELFPPTLGSISYDFFPLVWNEFVPYAVSAFKPRDRSPRMLSPMINDIQLLQKGFMIRRKATSRETATKDAFVKYKF
jgi:hypothetical protein